MEATLFKTGGHSFGFAKIRVGKPAMGDARGPVDECHAVGHDAWVRGLRPLYGSLLAVAVSGCHSTKAAGVTADSGSSDETTADSGSSDETTEETGEPEDCEWEPVDDDSCWPMNPSVPPNDNLDGLAVALPAGGSLASAGGQLHAVARWWYAPDLEGLTEEVQRYYHKENDLWDIIGVEEASRDPDLAVSSDGALWVSGDLWSEADGLILHATQEGSPDFYHAAARPELTTAYATGSRGIWSMDAGCLRQRWRLPDCGFVVGAPITLAADGRLFMATSGPEFRIHVFDGDKVETLVAFDVPDNVFFLVGDIVVDDTGKIHTCYQSPYVDALVYGHGHTTADWEEITYDGIFGNGCRLAVTADGTSVWASGSNTIVQVEAPEPGAPPDLPEDLSILFDMALTVDDQLVLLASVGESPEQKTLVLARLEADTWVLETIDGG